MMIDNISVKVNINIYVLQEYLHRLSIILSINKRQRKPGQSRDINWQHKTQENVKKHDTTQKINKMSNMDPIKHRG